MITTPSLEEKRSDLEISTSLKSPDRPVRYLFLNIFKMPTEDFEVDGVKRHP